MVSDTFLQRRACLQAAGAPEAEALPRESDDGRRSCLHFSIGACHPCAGAMLIFSVSLQFYVTDDARRESCGRRSCSYVGADTRPMTEDPSEALRSRLNDKHLKLRNTLKACETWEAKEPFDSRSLQGSVRKASTNHPSPQPWRASCIQKWPILCPRHLGHRSGPSFECCCAHRPPSRAPQPPRAEATGPTLRPPRQPAPVRGEGVEGERLGARQGAAGDGTARRCAAPAENDGGGSGVI